MLNGFRKSVAMIGLHMNPGKCSIQCSGALAAKGKMIKLGGELLDSKCLVKWSLLAALLKLSLVQDYGRHGQKLGVGSNFYA